MHWHTLGTVIRWVLGCLLIYAALFLYEDEEGRFQNRLENWLRAVGEKRDVALTKASAFMGGIAELTAEMFDRLFGTKLFSIRGVGVSVCYSIASLFIFGGMAQIFKRTQPGTPSLTVWSLATFFLLLGSIPALAGERRETLWVWGAAIFSSVVFPFARLFDVVAPHLGYGRSLRMSGFVVLLFAISFGFDVLYIGFTRWMLRKASRMHDLKKIIAVIALDCLLGIALFFGPIAFGVVTLISLNKLHAPQSLDVTGVGLMLGTALNLIDVIACSAFLVLLIFMLLQRLLWPIMERPLYAAFRFQVIRNKTLLWTAGVGLLSISKIAALINWIAKI